MMAFLDVAVLGYKSDSYLLTNTLLGAGLGYWYPVLLVLAGIAALLVLIVAAIFAKWGAYWVQAYMSGADVSFASLIAMTFLKIDHRMIVDAKIMGKQSGLKIDKSEGGMSTARLQAHALAGGNVKRLVQALIVAKRADMVLDFDRAAAIDLAGRDVLQAVQTSVSPKVIRCPLDNGTGRNSLSAVAKNGVELLVSVRVTVRTNIDQLIGGATEETIVARVGQGIVTAIGSAESHMDVLARPSLISKSTFANGLDANTAFSIVSIDIADIDVGQNIGARLQIDQADADTRIARAQAEQRRTSAVALTQENKAKVVEKRASLCLAQAEIPPAMAVAIRAGRLQGDHSNVLNQVFPSVWIHAEHQGNVDECLTS